ncbi:MAG: metal ABC transporter permease, partial [Thermoproteota archaeon]
MQKAIISGIAIALLCSVVGLFLVLRRYSLFGDAVAHSSFGGIAAGLLVGVYPLWTAYLVSLASALIITKIRQKFDISGEAAVAVLLSSGIAVGLILISLSGGFTTDIFSFLFGSILLVSTENT